MDPAGTSGSDAVTPVIGTIMILAITVLGIGAIMFWGAPTLQAIQDRNALTAMEGEFLEIRTGTLDLTIDKASRLPEVVVEAGELGVERGTRFLIANNAFSTPCDVRITEWNDGAARRFTFDLTGGCPMTPGLVCPSPVGSMAAGVHCLQVQSVVGTSATDRAYTIVSGTGPWELELTDATLDLGAGDWAFRLRDRTNAIEGQAWILSTNRITWSLTSTASQVGTDLEAGAVFERNGVKVFLLKAPQIAEASAAPGDFVMWMPTYIGDDITSVSARTSVRMFIAQVGNTHLRISDGATTSVRLDFAGDLAEAWCESLLLRNPRLPSGSYAVDGTCTDTVPSLVYTETNPTFSFELLHARITARLQF